MSVSDRGYAGTVARNAFWNVLQYLVTGITGIAVSVLTARYLGATDFGVLSYVLWLTAMAATVIDLGLDQVLRKYVPAWFPHPGTRARALRLVGSAIAIEVAAGALITVLLVALFPWWSRSLTIAHPQLELIVAIGLVTVLPVAASRCVATFLRSVQSTRALVMVSLATQTANLALVAAAVALKLPLPAFVVTTLATQLALALALGATLRRFGGAPAAPSPGPWPMGELTKYGLIAYAQLLLQQVVWTRSETFFLGLYAPSREVGFYGVAYNVAGMIGGLVGVSQQALFAAQFELLATREDERSDRLASLSIKYLAAAFLPLGLVSWLFMDSAVALLYGPDYAMAARLFPFLLFGMIVANCLNPVVIKLHRSNRKLVATLGIALVGAALNIGLDLLLIPAHHAWGAALANGASQVGIVAISMTFVAMVSPVRIELRPIGVVALVNLILAGVVWFVLQRADLLAVKLGVTALAAALYLPWLSAWGVIDAGDRSLLASLEAGAPPWLRPALGWVRRGLRGEGE